MTPQEYGYLQNMLKERSGLVLSEDKQYLIESRLSPVVKKNGLENISDLIRKLQLPGSENLKSAVTEAMTINESFFFRDKTPFKNFEEVMMPSLLKARQAKRSLRIWSAAASSGQELYSLAILIKEKGDAFRSWKVELMGTDISTEILEKAKTGLYSQFEVQRGMPSPLLVKYFQQVGSLWQVESGLRAMVSFRNYNLLDNFSSLGTFDIVFCRNVLIYFDRETKQDVLERIARQMAPDGYLVLGAAETIVGITDKFEPVDGRQGLLRLKNGSAVGALSESSPLQQAAADLAANAKKIA